jgi:hypothetical protein
MNEEIKKFEEMLRTTNKNEVVLNEDHPLNGDKGPSIIDLASKAHYYGFSEFESQHSNDFSKRTMIFKRPVEYAQA